MLTNRNVSLMLRGKLYSSCVQSRTLHESQTWPMGEKGGVALQRARVGVVGWMCSIELQDGVTGGGLRERERDRLGLQDIISVLQQNRL